MFFYKQQSYLYISKPWVHLYISAYVMLINPPQLQRDSKTLCIIYFSYCFQTYLRTKVHFSLWFDWSLRGFPLKVSFFPFPFPAETYIPATSEWLGENTRTALCLQSKSSQIYPPMTDVSHGRFIILDSMNRTNDVVDLLTQFSS